MKKHSNFGFTLVELIVVISIIGILASIGFVSYSTYLISVRDTNRVTQLIAINDGLEAYKTKGNLPIPDDYVDLRANNNLFAYQGYAGMTTLESIEYSSVGKDPKFDHYFTYYLSTDRKSFQLMTHLEDQDNLITFSPLNQSHAFNDYSTKYVKVYGKKLGILTDGDQTPIQEVDQYVAAGKVDLATNTGTLIAFYDDSTKFTGTGTTLLSSRPNASCKRIKDLKGGSQDGLYTIDPAADGIGYPVYCNMTTDGGGWTYATMLADITTKNLFYTTNTDKILSLRDNISTKGRLDDIWYDEENKDILLHCYTTSGALKSYEQPLVIYDYAKSDIGHLTKDAKAGTTFSTTALTAKRKNNKFILDTTYGGTTPVNTMYLKSGGSLVTNMYDSRKFRVKNDSYLNGPAYSTTDAEIVIDTENYCMTAIR